VSAATASAPSPRVPAEAVLEARALRRSFGRVEALRGLSLRLDGGEIYGLVGPDGAGKTTALRILAGVMAPTSGEARVLGQKPLDASPTLRSAIGYMPQQYSLYGDLTVEENLSFFSRMSCLGRAEHAKRRERLLGITRLGPFTDRRADALSGGMYKKLALACVLLPRPRVLLLDEPTNGVDPISRRELWALLFELADEGMAILISTPYMDEAERCHRVGLVREGSLLLEGTPAALLGRFPHAVLEIHTADRSAAESLLEGHAGVIAVSAAGARLRVVVRRDAASEVGALLEGAEARAVKPDFEDLFLAAISTDTSGAATHGAEGGEARAT
jgi:ABC-2 type transport system ATP-binding protein